MPLMPWSACVMRRCGRSIYISEAQIENLAATWEKRWNRPPTGPELIGLVRAYLREDVMYREALAMGLDNDDHVIRRRLAQKLEFLTNDIVGLQQPSAAELEAYFARNLDVFAAPDRVTFVQAFFNPDMRGDSAEADALAARTRLQAGGEPDPGALSEGDRSMLQAYFVGVSEQDLRRDMGADFAASVMQLDPGRMARARTVRIRCAPRVCLWLRACTAAAAGCYAGKGGG